METVSAEIESTAQLKDTGSSSKSTGGQFAPKAEKEEDRAKDSATVVDGKFLPRDQYFPRSILERVICL